MIAAPSLKHREAEGTARRMRAGCYNRVVKLLRRYVAGECRSVWDELRACGEVVRTPALLSEAEAVVHETMVRVRRTIERLVVGLTQHGFQFGRYPDGEVVPAYAGPIVPPSPDVESQIREIESLVGGPVPLSLAGFWRYVGSVNLVGFHRQWPDGTDPLWVEPLSATIQEFPEWLDRRLTDPDEPPFGAPIAPDVLHKDNISGGLPYEIVLPDGSIDGLLTDEHKKVAFVDYLRQAVDWAGYPGFASNPDTLPNWLNKLRDIGEPF